MSEPIFPVDSGAAHEGSLDRRKGHTHPEPAWLRMALVSFAVGLGLILALVFYALHQVSTESTARQQSTLRAAQVVAESTRQQCQDRQISARQSIVTYGDALKMLPATDTSPTSVVVRQILNGALAAAQRGVAIDCTLPEVGSASN